VRCGREIVATSVVRVGPRAAAATAEGALGANWRGRPSFFRDPTTWAAAAIVAVIAIVVPGLRAARSQVAARRG